MKRIRFLIGIVAVICFSVQGCNQAELPLPTTSTADLVSGGYPTLDELKNIYPDLHVAPATYKPSYDGVFTPLWLAESTDEKGKAVKVEVYTFTDPEEQGIFQETPGTCDKRLTYHVKIGYVKLQCTEPGNTCG